MALDTTLKLNIDDAGSTKSLKQLREEIELMKKELETVDVGSKKFLDLRNSIGEAQDQVEDLTGSLKGIKPGDLGQQFLNMGQSIAGGFAAAQGAMALFGRDNEELNEAFMKSQAAMALAMGLRELNEIRLRGAILARAVAEKAATIATTAGTVAMQIFNKVVMSGPWGWLAAAVVGIAGAFTAFKLSANEASEAQKEFTLLTDELNNKIIEETAAAASLFEQLKNTNAGSAEREDLIKKINSTYGTTLKNLSDEAAFLKQIDQQYKNVTDSLKRKLILESQQEKLTELIKAELTIVEGLNKAREKGNKDAIALGEKYLKVVRNEQKYIIDHGNELIKQLGIQGQVVEVKKEDTKTTEKKTETTKKDTEAIKEQQTALEGWLDMQIEIQDYEKEQADLLAKQNRVGASKSPEVIQSENAAMSQVEIERQKWADIEQITKDSLASIASINAAFSKDETKLKREAAEEQARIDEYFKETGIKLVNEKQKEYEKVAKRAEAFRKAQTLLEIGIDTAKAVSSLMAASEGNPLNLLTGGVAGIVQFTTGMARILANVAAAKQLLSSKGDFSVQASSSGGGFAPPKIGAGSIGVDPPRLTNNNRTIIDEEQRRRGSEGSNTIIKTYVVQSEMTASQRKESVLKRRATK